MPKGKFVCFCQIASGESRASIFYEDEVMYGVMTIGPVTTGHAMVISKRHAAYLADMNDETGQHFWTITQRTAAILQAVNRAQAAIRARDAGLGK